MAAWSDVLRLTPLGRIHREAFWWSAAASALGFGAAAAAAGDAAVLAAEAPLSAVGASGWGRLFFGAVLLVLSCAVLLCASARRLREAGCSPWWALLVLLPAVNAAAILVFGLLPGRSGRTDEATGQEPKPQAPNLQRAASAAGFHSPTIAAAAGAAFPPELDAAGRPTPAQFLWEQTAGACAGETLTLQLQVKVRAVEKLKKLVKRGELEADQFELWRRRLMAIDPDGLAGPR